jgi:pseudomonalisin
MNKSLLYASLAVGILTTACSGNTTAPLLPGTSMSVPNGTYGGAPLEKMPQGWTATATQALPVKGFAEKATSRNVSASMPLHIVVGLYMHDSAGAQKFVASQFTPGNVQFRKWLTPSQFTAMFNPTRSEAAAVADYLRSQGFTKVSIEPNNLIVSATGRLARVEAAFHTSIRGVVANGEVVYGNATPALVPAKFRKLVAAILGLNNAYQMHVHLLRTKYPRFASLGSMAQQGVAHAVGTPPPCLQVVKGICIGGEYGPTQYQVAYDAYKCKGCSTGSGTTVAVMAEGDVTQVVKDLRTAETFWGLPKVPYAVVKVGASSGDTSGLDEWDLDTQISSGIAQTVRKLYVYDTTSLSDSDITLEYSHWVNDNITQAGNSSFGEPESLAFADGAMLLDDEELNQAASQGMTMFASTGDNGVGCPVLLATGLPSTGVPEVCYPATSPYAVAVGGTTLDTNAVGNQPGTYYGEHVWVGTGGGLSKYESAAYWQYNGICGACGPGKIRGMADIAMCADNNGCPMDVFVSGAQTGVGGTSLSSPMSMGVWARLQTHFRNTLGFASPVYYGVYGYYEPCPLGSTACTPAGEPGDDTSAAPPDTTAPVGGFHDILFGTNGIPSSAGPGWDIPTGLGTVDYAVMQRDISNSIFSGH